MKAIKQHETFDDEGDENGFEEESFDLAELVSESLDSVDFYAGRETEYVLDKVLNSFGLLLDVLAEKELLNAQDIERIVPVSIVRLEKRET